MKVEVRLKTASKINSLSKRVDKLSKELKKIQEKQKYINASDIEVVSLSCGGISTLQKYINKQEDRNTKISAAKVEVFTKKYGCITLQDLIEKKKTNLNGQAKYKHIKT